VPPYHRSTRRAGKTGTDSAQSVISAGHHADRIAAGRKIGSRKLWLRGGLAVALVAGALFATGTVAGAAPGTPGLATAAQQGVERAIITHPERDYMGWSARQAAALEAKLPKGSLPVGAPNRGGASVQSTVPAPDRGLNTRAVTPAATTTPTAGVDVSHWQGNTDWAYWWRNGRKFAYVKATEGTTYRDPSFSYQYSGSYQVGMIRGSYHFATPNTSSGAAQANFFAAHGGGWSRDGRTLPGVLDIEFNPYGATCYGLSKAAMVNWVRDFTRTYKTRTGRDAVIYTSLSWWVTCTGNSGAFASTNPLWIPRYATSPGQLPGGWGFHTIWQHTDTPLDQDVFNGSLARLQALARG
jgi:GH25 family lysozyme M1 (1,4-beta-N-acetylmuramidase)